MRSAVSRSSVILTVLLLALGLLGVGVASAAPSAKVTPTLTLTAYEIRDFEGPSPRTRIYVDATADGETPAGTVEGYDDTGALHGTSTLVDGSTYVDERSLLAALPGTYTFEVRYLGDDTTEPATGSVQIVIPQRASTTTATATPVQVAVGGGRSVVAVSVVSSDREGSRGVYDPPGTVKLTNDEASGGTATLQPGVQDGASVTVGPFPHPGVYDFTATYSGDPGVVVPSVTHISVTAFDGAASTISATTATPTVAVRRQASTVEVRVSSAGDQVPIGKVVLSHRGRTVGTGVLADGSAAVDVGPFRAPGTYPVTVSYGGDDVTAPAVSRTVQVTVVKAAPRVVVYAPPNVERGARPYVTVRMVSPEGQVGGRVRLSYRGRTITAPLSSGSTAFRLASMRGLGAFTVRAAYLGGTLYAPASLTRTITVVLR